MPHIQKIDRSNLTPIRWDLSWKGKTIKTVRFDNMQFKIGDKLYEIRGTTFISDEKSKDYGDNIHLIMNAKTGEKREVSGVTIRQWLENSIPINELLTNLNN